MNWLIVEDALRDRRGHWYEYVSTFRHGLAEFGDGLEILVSRECTPEVAEALRARPVLPASIWAKMSDGAGALRRYARVPGHGCATFLALRRVFSFQSAVGREQKAESRRQIADSKWQDAEGGSNEWVPDVIFVPTVLVHHLLGWWMLLKTGSVPKSSRVLLFFPNAPVRLTEEGRGVMNADPTGRLFKWCVRRLAREVRDGRVVLGAETQAMQRALSQATGVEFTYLPHPVDALPTQSAGAVRSKELRVKSNEQVDKVTRGELRVARQGGATAPAKTVVFGCYGAARWEKGADVLQAAVRQVLEEDPQIPAKFVFQWLEDFDNERGERVTLDPWVRDHPKVEVIRRYFEEGEYARRLAETDVMVLPYRLPYRLRVSRVVIEAMAAGCAVIATRGTTLFDQGERYGVVLGCEEGSADSLVRSIVELTEGRGETREEARRKSKTVAQSFSVGHFRALLW